MRRERPAYGSVALGVAIWGMFEIKIVGAPLIGFSMIGWFGALIWACAAKSGDARLRDAENAQEMRDLVEELRDAESPTKSLPK